MVNLNYVLTFVMTTMLYLQYVEAQKALKQALNTKEMFISGFSHEIRNPLNGIIGNIEMAKSETTQGSVRELLSKAEACSEVLLSMINTILDNAKA